MTFIPSIDPAIWAIAPGYRALSLHVRRPEGGPRIPAAATLAMDGAVAAVRAGAPAWGQAHLAAWGDVFRRFGAKPQRTPCSAQSLHDRVMKSGTLAAIDPVVDLYNAVSLKFAVPVGGENVSAYRGSPRLVVADGSETFDTVKNGEPAIEHPEPGEVIWRDEVGVTCRRWNWRQGVRTKLSTSVTEMWFVLDSLPEMPLEGLERAGAELLAGLDALFGETQSDIMLLQQE